MSDSNDESDFIDDSDDPNGFMSEKYDEEWIPNDEDNPKGKKSSRIPRKKHRNRKKRGSPKSDSDESYCPSEAEVSSSDHKPAKGHIKVKQSVPTEVSLRNRRKSTENANVTSTTKSSHPEPSRDLKSPPVASLNQGKVGELKETMSAFLGASDSAKDPPNEDDDLQDTEEDEVKRKKPRATGQKQNTGDESACKHKRLRKFNAIKMEAEELTTEAQAFINARRKSKDSTADESSGDEEDIVQLPPVSPLCRMCTPPSQMVLRYTQETGEAFYSCRCTDFMWSKEAWNHLPSGPSCHCGVPSAAIRDRETGECRWVCSKTSAVSSHPCAFEKDMEDGDVQLYGPSVPDSPPMKHSQRDEQFLVGETTRQALQALLHIPPEDSDKVGKGVSNPGQYPAGYYDYVKVERAWRVLSPEAQVNAFRQYRAARGEELQGSMKTETRQPFAEAVEGLIEAENGLLDSLDRNSNEQLLLHGTRPEVVAQILEQSLDPGLARLGLFGRGTYFAEHAAKIDQYVTEDTEYCGGRRQRRYKTLCQLHNKLYPRPDLHPGYACYALVCRVVFGKPSAMNQLCDGPTNGCDSVLGTPPNSNLNF